MTQHVFHFTQTASTVVVIESDTTREEAEERAWDRLPGSLCHKCADKIEFDPGNWELLPDQVDER